MRKPNINRIKKQLDDIEESLMENAEKNEKIAALEEQLEKIEDQDSREAINLRMEIAFLNGLTFADMVRKVAAYEQEHAENNPEIA